MSLSCMRNFTVWSHICEPCRKAITIAAGSVTQNRWQVIGELPDQWLCGHRAPTGWHHTGAPVITALKQLLTTPQLYSSRR